MTLGHKTFLNGMVTDKLTNGYRQTNIEIPFAAGNGAANGMAAEYQNETTTSRVGSIADEVIGMDVGLITVRTVVHDRFSRLQFKIV
jgi:hypothetical protein